MRVVRLVGVYDADGSTLGELSYFIRARFGRAHCALCEITHGRVRERSAWRACRDTLPVPFVTHHRDDLPPTLRRAVTAYPVVLAEPEDGEAVEVVPPAQLAGCHGDPERLVARIEEGVQRAGLSW